MPHTENDSKKLIMNGLQLVYCQLCHCQKFAVSGLIVAFDVFSEKSVFFWRKISCTRILPNVILGLFEVVTIQWIVNSKKLSQSGSISND